jgi:hypothetical protein
MVAEHALTKKQTIKTRRSARSILDWIEDEAMFRIPQLQDFLLDGLF